MIYLDAGTTYSKIITDETGFDKRFFKKTKDQNNYYIYPSSIVKSMNLTPTRSCGHMVNSSENEIIALANGVNKKGIDTNATVLDLGSRDAKWIRFKDAKFHDMDWNTSCASSTGATVEMLLKFYDVNPNELKYDPEKFNVTCGIFGMEKIMDSISSGVKPSEAISKFVHGIAYNAWNFAKRPEKIYLSGGFCENKCLVDSLANYCEVVPLGRFVLCEGLIK
jgi:Activator of 2-hydroxyglutaryl-CoA dehydratase (HSP70-class ATPase domain)